VIAMTDWERITEQIQRAMQVLDKAHEAGENLRENTTPEAVDAFKEQLSELYEHLRTMEYIWEHQYNYSMDELSDVLSQMFSGKPSAYRGSPRYEEESSKD
jgi:uncharacterized protein YaaR (DUF327 family)